MDASEFLGLAPTHNPMRWTLPVTQGISTGHGFLFGGCGLGAAIAALEETTRRPLIWATGQYLSYARPPSVMDIDVVIGAAGNSVTQARAVAHVADTEILTVNAALGVRDEPDRGTWPRMPAVPDPGDCPLRTHRMEVEESIMTRMEARLASARDHTELDGLPSADGRSALWARMPDIGGTAPAALAILGDYVPFGIGQAIGQPAGGNSLDNTLRIAHLVPTEWVLVDIRIDAVANGFGQGRVHLWASDGTLLATASQSTIVRYWEERRPAGVEADRQDHQQTRDQEVAR